jgi:hypothetical protein
MSALTDQRPIPFADLPAEERARIVDDLLQPFVNLGRPKQPPEEFERLARGLYERQVVPRLTSDDDGRFVVLDTESGEFELDDDSFAASRRLAVRCPGAVLWETRVGSVRTVVPRLVWTRA